MSSRKALRTLQMAPNLDLGSCNENDVIKPHKAISNKSKPKQPSRAALSECKENAESILNAKAKVNHNNRVNEKSDPITPTVTKSSKCEEILEKETPLSDSFNELYWMTAVEPPEPYWKELAEQRCVAVEEAKLENFDLSTKLENQAVEISRLRVLTLEVEELRDLLEDIIGLVSDEFEPKQHSGIALNKCGGKPETILNEKAIVNHNNQVNEKLELTDDEERLEKKSISDSFDEIDFITTTNALVGHWKEIAEQRRVDLEELLLLNEELHTKVEAQDEEISRLRKLTVEVNRLKAILEALTDGHDEIDC